MATRRRPVPVTVYLIAALVVCGLALGGLMARVTLTSFQRERSANRTQLRWIAQETKQSNETWLSSTADLAQRFGTDPRVVSDADFCNATFGPLGAAIQAGGHIHIIARDSTVVCSVYDAATKNPPPFPIGPWMAQVVATNKTVAAEPTIDTGSGVPVLLVAAPIADEAGAVRGVMAVVSPTGYPTLTIPAQAPKGAVLLLVDRQRDLVLARSPHAPAKLGRRLTGTALSRVLPRNGVVTDVDGRQRIYQDVKIDSLGWHVLAGLPLDVALAPARADMRRNIVVGVIAMAILLALGLLLHRRLARPILRVEKAIRASLEGDTAEAPIEGPAEIARVAAVFNDLMVERRAREADLYERARRDPLTRLPNRTALTEALTEALADRDGHGVAVMFLDLDRFKHVNDAYGHATGDQLLIALGARLKESFADALVARFGGDEYVILCRDVYTEAQAADSASRVATILHSPFRVDSQELFVSGSVGIALSRRGDTADDLLRNADTAMYRAKERGSAGYSIFDQAMREWIMNRADTEHDLHRALARDEFVLHYQPKISITDGQLVGVEALVRWQHPARGLVQPAEFIPVAEDCGLITPIGDWVLREACRQAVDWRRTAGGLAVPVAVNLAARQLGVPSLTTIVGDALTDAGASPSDLVLEVTETAVLEDVEGASARLQAVRDMGVKVSVDDFGTGYSSLSYLQKLPIDELKIDRTFVAPMPYDAGSSAIVASVIGLAHAIGLTVVAEGVETERHLDELTRLDCDLAQGYYLARPAPAAALTARLTEREFVTGR